jgi:hypothetical protein
MSVGISRVEYKSFENLYGRECAGFIDDNFYTNDDRRFFITEDSIKEVETQLKYKLTKEQKVWLRELKKEVKEHGEFDLSIDW